MEPIRPEDVKAHSRDDTIIEIVNKMIEQEWDGTRAQLYLRDVADAYMHLTGLSAYAQKVLSFEQIYRDAGWKVVFDKPAYNDSYPAIYTFSR